MPSVVTLGSLAFVVAAGVGYAVISAATADPATEGTHTVHHPSPSTPSKTTSSPRQVTKPPAKSPSTAAVPSVLVVLFNNQGVAGVAEAKAAILQNAGWNVVATDNWYGKIPANTVYYPPQLQADAVKLAKVLHITRLHPAVAPMQFDELTVIFSTG